VCTPEEVVPRQFDGLLEGDETKIHLVVVMVMVM
jgi:hypothetical protein